MVKEKAMGCLQGLCHCPHSQRNKEKAWATLQGVTWQFKGLRMASWCDGSFTRKPVFGIGELFLSPAPLWSQCCPRETGSLCSKEMPDMAPGCQILLPPVLHLHPHLPQPWAKQTWYLSLLKELKGNPHGFCRSRVSGKTLKNHWFIGPSKSPTMHHRVLPADLNTA